MMILLCTMFWMILSWVAVPVAAAVDLLPNLQALPAEDIHLETTSSGRTLLLFSATSWNNGTGPLELVAGAVDRRRRKQKVYQRVYAEDGSYRSRLAGSFVWHQQHNHFHFQNYARYILKPVTAGGAERTSIKTTFCVMDTTPVNTELPEAPQAPVYRTCRRSVQGMSVGWGDTYEYYLAGQEIDVTDLPDGIYELKIVVDPRNLLLESDGTDNTSWVRIRLRGDTVQVISTSEE